MDGFNATGQLAAASRSLGGVPYYPNSCVYCGACPLPGRSNLLTALGTNRFPRRRDIGHTILYELNTRFRGRTSALDCECGGPGHRGPAADTYLVLRTP